MKFKEIKVGQEFRVKGIEIVFIKKEADAKGCNAITKDGVQKETSLMGDTEVEISRSDAG